MLSVLVSHLYDDFITHPTFNFNNRPPPVPSAPKPILNKDPLNEPSSLEAKERLLFTPPLNIPPPTFESAMTVATQQHHTRSGIELAG